MWEIATPGVLIALAGGSFALGYLIINQMMLRSMMLIGSAFYVAYYATAATEPLWGAIYTTLAMMVTNLVGMASLSLRRFRIALPRAHADIYHHFKRLTPGDFRLVMRHAERLIVEQDTEITTEGAPVRHLSFIVSGSARVSKRGAHFSLPDGIFVGEVAYLLERNSVATTIVPAKTELVRWDLDALRRLTPRNPRFKLAMDAMLSHDLAAKVAEAVAQPALVRKGEEESASR